MAELKVVSGKNEGQTLSVKTGKDQTIGSSATADVRVKEDGVARKHFKIAFNGQSWKLIAIAVTLVNGNAVDGETEIKHGDKIEAGSATLEFVSEETGMAGGSGGISEADLAGLM